ncbi:ceramide glucosyltransferase [Faunimonas pinastri]|uniref:Ceramide glucosyltransferase n=1 Tax=Faunimonas pinastri TaxID=1855383 RepID=A0A1H9AJX9_9HYPH|nr:bacteriohopanetetrol glucosamine biosynthesis glycosyltransferase HpnI [Faunimonas pinastri]SEP76693.1 ceramide glucosyltransferase [Faunimonas pinastri]
MSRSMAWLASLSFWLSVLCLVVAGIGSLYLALSAVLVWRFRRDEPPAPAVFPAVSILKPLHLDEPGLFDNLRSFCEQDYPAAVQIVLGVQDAADPVIAIVRELQRRFPERRLDLVVSDRQHGRNRKVSNLINIGEAAVHEVLVLSDSDIAVEPDYLRRVVSELSQPGVKGVTCLYHGLPIGGFWARLSALAVDTHFLPNVVTGVSLGMANPCMGSTVAFTRPSLEAIGGFRPLADSLADDYELGERLRQLGGRVAVPGLAVGHVSSEHTANELWHHELRWQRTIRSVDPAGHAGSFLTHPLPFALFGWFLGTQTAFGGADVAVWPGGALCLLAICCRMAIGCAGARRFNLRHHQILLVPFRDLLSFGLFVASFFGKTVRWKSDAFLVSGGTLTQAGADRSDADVVSSSSLL